VATAVRTDPYRSYNFLVELDGITQASFSECSGLDSHTEVIENHQGGDNVVYKLPGKTSFSNLTLKWGLTDSTELWAWRLAVMEGNVQRKHGSIVVYDLANSTEVARWNFVNAWPAKWTGPAFDAKGNAIAIETLELAHEGITRA
jgi:phage tail-like protein